MAAQIKDKYSPEERRVAIRDGRRSRSCKPRYAQIVKGRGYMVTETVDEDGRLSGVSDEGGRNDDGVSASALIRVHWTD